MRVKRFEQLLKDLLVQADHPEIVHVGTFEEDGYTDKPCGLHVKFASGAEAWMQFVRTSPPAGDNHSQSERVVTRAEYDVRGDDRLTSGSPTN